MLTVEKVEVLEMKGFMRFMVYDNEKAIAFSEKDGLALLQLNMGFKDLKKIPADMRDINFFAENESDALEKAQILINEITLLYI